MKAGAYICLFLGLAAVACSEETSPPVMHESQEQVQHILAATEPAANNPFASPGDDAPDAGCVKLRIKPMAALRRAFNDSNHVHLQAARTLGIQPVSDDASILQLRRRLVPVASCPEYYVDDLQHSFAFLVPEAEQLLRDIGRAFADSLARQGGGDYRIKVTSLLRTPATVKRLRRVNRNATGESTHSYGTTFDISYSKFICDNAAGTHRSFEDLKNLLANVLYDLRSQGRCLVKYEYRQSCFHITVCPRSHDATQP